MLRILDGENALDSLLVRIEPAVNRAVDLSFGGGLLRRETGERVELTEAGVAAAEKLRNTVGVFDEEKTFFANVGGRATEEFVKRLFNSAGRR